MSAAQPTATTAAPFRGGLMYVHPDDAHLIPASLKTTSVKLHHYPVPVHPAPTGASENQQAEPIAFDTTPATTAQQAPPRSVRDFVRAMRMPKCRPAAKRKPFPQGQATETDLSPAPQSDSSTDYTKYALRLLKEEESRTGHRASIQFVPDARMLSELTAAFESNTALPHIGEDEAVSEDEKALLAKSTLSYNESWAAAQEEPLYYELQQHAMLLLGFIRQLNRILWHFGRDQKYEAHLVISSPTDINADFKLCVRPRRPGPPMSRDMPPDAIFVIEYKRSEVAGEDRMDKLLDDLVAGPQRIGRGMVVERAASGDRLVWYIVDAIGTRREIGGTGGAHKALLQSFFQAHQYRTAWTSVLAGTRSIMCRLDRPWVMAVSTASMSGAETFPGEATLPKSVIALAFDRVLNPIRSAATGLFLDVTAIVEQAQIDKKRKETPAATEASVKRSRAVDTVPASGKNLPTDVAEMPPPPIPTRTAARAQERGVKQETQPIVGMALIPEIPMPDPNPPGGLQDKKRSGPESTEPLNGVVPFQLDSSTIWLDDRAPGAVTLGLAVKPTPLARGRYFDVYEAFIPLLEAKRIRDVGQDAVTDPSEEEPLQQALPAQDPISGSSSPSNPASSSPVRAASRSSSKRGRESLESDTSEQGSTMSKSFHSSLSSSSTEVDPWEGVQYLPVVIKICTPSMMRTRWEADWEEAPITAEECADAARAAVINETQLYRGRLHPLQGILVPGYLGTWTVRSGLAGLQSHSETYAIVLERLGATVVDDLASDAEYF